MCRACRTIIVISPCVFRPAFRPLLGLLLGGLLASTGNVAFAEEELESASRPIEVIWEASPYYSSVGVLLPFTEAPLALAGDSVGEFDAYRRLFANSMRPSIVLLEASVYPMPLLGTEIRRRYPEQYEQDSQNARLIPAVTSGFQEPWALSFFLGNDMLFVRQGQPTKETNRGYMGWLVSVGDKHIKDNLLIDDRWAEFEWKMKGERVFDEDRLTWSFRLGARFHEHPNIGNTLYVGLERSSLDFNAPLLSWMQNTKTRVLTEFLQETGEFARQELIFGKKIPVAAWRSAMLLEFGAIYERSAKYSGGLETTGRSGLTVILRPNIEF